MRPHNRIHVEVERMPWPEIVPDELNDARRENARLYQAGLHWQRVAFFLLVVIVALLLFTLIVVLAAFGGEK
jgi:Flp pilus assembly protein TadB